MGFQTQVNLQQAPALAGDFASSNPRAAHVQPEDGFVAGSAGVTVGRFAWIGSDGRTLNNFGQGKPQGFIARRQQALITTFLAEASNLVPSGMNLTLMTTGDYYATANTSAAVYGEKAFAKLQDGSTAFFNTGSAPTSASITAAQSGTVLTVSAVGSGSLTVGDLVTQASGTPAYILAQLTGTAGSTGTYTLSVSQTVSSGAATATSYIETDFVCTRGCASGELAIMTK